MLDKLLEIDTQVLLAINGWHAPWADSVMWVISAKATWIPLYLLLIGLLVWKYRRPISTAKWKWLQKVPTCVVMILVIAAAVGVADFIASGILKELVARPRPTRVPELEDRGQPLQQFPAVAFPLLCQEYRVLTLSESRLPSAR